jgi:hypothetical protein
MLGHPRTVYILTGNCNNFSLLFARMGLSALLRRRTGVRDGRGRRRCGVSGRCVIVRLGVIIWRRIPVPGVIIPGIVRIIRVVAVVGP